MNESNFKSFLRNYTWQYPFKIGQNCWDIFGYVPIKHLLGKLQ